MSFSLSVEYYPAPTGQEFLLRSFTQYPNQVIIIEPLLEERSFLRRVIVDMARFLGAHGIGANIPDLPACGESLIDPSEVNLSIWCEAVSAATATVASETGGPVHIVALRGGTLIDHAADAASWWRFAPVSGPDLLRPFRRAQRLRGEIEDVDVTGYGFAPTMIELLEAATPTEPIGPLREVKADSGSVAPWNLAEPSRDIELSQYLADDISQWIATCEKH